MLEPCISVIVGTYNPKKNQLLSTLFTIILQQDVTFEIIISDDGSANFPQKAIDDFMNLYNFNNYSSIQHSENAGTIANIYDGLLKAKGEYVYIISPGDYLYDSHVLYNLYAFCKSNKIEFCFGDAVNYSINSGKIQLFKSKTPKCVIPFSYGHSYIYLEQIAFLSGQQPVGACYFRKRELFTRYINYIIGKVKYIEDYPTTVSMILDGIKLIHFNHPVVWYECASGISNSSQSKQRDIFVDDFNKADMYVQNKYHANKFVKARYDSKLNLIKYPMYLFFSALYKSLGRMKYHVSRVPSDTKGLELILDLNQEYITWEGRK